MSVVLVAICDHGTQWGTCPARTLPAPAADPAAAWGSWERDGWVQTHSGRVLCPTHSGRRR